MSIDRAWFALRWRELLKAKRVAASNASIDQGEAYYDFLRDLNQNLLDKAIDDVIASSTYFPSIKDINKAYETHYIECQRKKEYLNYAVDEAYLAEAIPFVEAEDIIRTRAKEPMRSILLDIIYQAKRDLPF